MTKFNLYINENIDKNLHSYFINEVKKLRNQGGHWVIEKEEYVIIKSEINLVDEIDDYTVEFSNEDSNSSDYILVEVA